MKSIPIIIINWNGIEDTKECIASVLELCNVQFHIHLIDNNSGGNEGSLLESKYELNSNITVYKYSENYGFAGAHNKIWQDILSVEDIDYVALLNNDTTVDPEWLIQLVISAQEHKAQVIASKMIQYYKRELLDNAGHQVISTGEIVPIGHNQPIGDNNIPLSNSGACGGGCLYEAQMIKEIGFFDSHFKTGYEDAEFGVRALILGKKTIYSPKAVLYHKGGKSIKKVFDNRYAIHTQRNILYTFFKLFPLIQIIFYYPIILFKSLVTIIVSLIFLKWNNAKILIKAHVEFILNDFYKAIQARKMLNENHKFDNLMTFYRSQKPFGSFELNRLYTYLILRKPSALDKYR
ncbi:MAG: glycosyltransferase family 2 protein [Saprospiraceae bacterium]